MAFFDKKEEVIDIQLTQYGKHLLSKGLFRPVSYAFLMIMCCMIAVMLD